MLHLSNSRDTKPVTMKDIATLNGNYVQVPVVVL